MMPQEIPDVTEKKWSNEMVEKRTARFGTALLLCSCFAGQTAGFHFAGSALLGRRWESKSLVASLPRGGFRSCLRMMGEDEKGSEKWAVSIQDENVERLESVKAGVLTAIAGSIAMAPIALAARSQFYPSDAFSAQWELSHDSLAIMLALFGIVYRYAVRQGVVGAFAITRSLAMLPVDTTCTPIPMNCGPPLGYFNWKMILQGSGAGLESLIAFGAAAAAVEFAYSQGWIRRFP